VAPAVGATAYSGHGGGGQARSVTLPGVVPAWQGGGGHDPSGWGVRGQGGGQAGWAGFGAVAFDGVAGASGWAQGGGHALTELAEPELEQGGGHFVGAWPAPDG
jgi:hypothetical protein